MQPLLSRYEVSRLVGLRALQLDAGAVPGVRVDDGALRRDSVYVAARELEARVLHALVRRAEGNVDVRTARLPVDLYSMLDTKDGRDRASRSHDSERASGASSAG